MATFFIDYVKLVLQAYERKKVSNTLPHGLEHLTPAKLKRECVMRCRKNLNTRDESVIRNFCGDLDESRTYLAIIQRCGTDKFRPLVKFLTGGSESTDPKNIELLAWLIEFPGRPWEMGKTYSDDMNEDSALSDAGPEEDGLITGANSPTSLFANEIEKRAENPIIPEIPIIMGGGGGSNGEKSADAKTVGTSIQGKLKGKSSKRLAAVVMLSLALGTGAMWWWLQPPDFSGGCMYWKEDHYEPAACNEKIPNAMVIALDSVKLKNFKKIILPDTITYLAKGTVWYSKINGNIEFYTSGGEHPVVYGHKLKPITNYMIDKYIRSNINVK